MNAGFTLTYEKHIIWSFLVLSVLYLKFRLNFPFLQSFHVTTGTGKEWRVVCYGSYSDIYVVDALSLEVDTNVHV